jgi:hypothetical protein
MPFDMELESRLRPPELPMAPYPAKFITLANGKHMVIREITREDVPRVLESVRPIMTYERDYYDIVASRVYAELLAWYRWRIVNEFCLIAQIDGMLVGLVNSRMLNAKTGMSLHTLTIDRGLRVGSHMFAAKMEHHIEYLKQDDILIVAESPIGFRRWMIEYGLEPTDIPHELGGAPSFRLSKELYYATKDRLVVGDRPVPKELMDQAMEEIIVVDEKTVAEKICGVKGR